MVLWSTFGVTKVRLPLSLPDSVDAENIDPNSPVDPSSPPTHNKKLRTPTGSPAVRTIGTPRPEFSNAPPPVALPQSPPPVAPLLCGSVHAS